MLLRFTLIFVTIAFGLSCSKSRVAQQSIPSAFATPTATPIIPDGWRRLEVTGKFAFYMPADMRLAPERVIFANPGGEFDNGHLRLSYSYRATDSCTPNSESQPPGHTRTDSTTSGKPAVLQTWGPDEAGQSGMTMCFLDIGDGKTQLTLGAMSKSQRDLDIARQVFASVQFLQRAT